MDRENKIANSLIEKTVVLLANAHKTIVSSINQTMVQIYFEIGRLIVEDEQQGNSRAKYGDAVLAELSNKLIVQFGKGYSITNLKQMRQFYLVYSNPQPKDAAIEQSASIGQTVSDQLLKAMEISNTKNGINSCINFP